MAKLSIVKFLSCLTFWFVSAAFTVDSPDLLPPDQAFHFTSKVKKADLLTLSWDIAGGCYLYRDKLKVFSLTPGIVVGKPSFPASHTQHDEFFGDVEIFRNRLEVEVPLQRQDPTLDTLILEVHFQGCSDAGVCYMPSQQTLSVNLPAASINGSSVAPTQNLYLPFVSEQNRIAATLQKGTVWLIVLSFLGLGIVLAFTPCVFPMLPILSGIVVGQGSSLNTRRAFWLSLSYVLASALTYTVFGILAGLFGSNLQALFQEPWVIIAFSGVFVVLALSMFGGFQFQIPSFIQTRVLGLSSKQQGGNLWGAAVMGILSALAIGPCVTAPLTGIDLYRANRRCGFGRIGAVRLRIRHGHTPDYRRYLCRQMAAQSGRLAKHHQSHFWHWAFGGCGVAIKSYPAADGYPGFMVPACDLSCHDVAMEKTLAGRRTACNGLRYSFVGGNFH